MRDLRAWEGQRLVAVTAAWCVARSGPRDLVDVWLRLEDTNFVHVDVAADWTLRIESGEPYRPYTMPELDSWVEVEAEPAQVPFTMHIGERLRRIIEIFDSTQPTELARAEFLFETGSVAAWSFGGDLHLAHPAVPGA